MQLLINGNYMEIPSEMDSVSSLLSYLKLGDKVVVVELNGNILEKDNQHQSLSDGDKLELVHFVGGG
ncbi:sulfur carrier protein ThiS [Virgibacillus sp. MSP4-1]|uniref:sulfur carrier protein ThiS n=1 Tax=Virgibacillus sp. MSP4-1 TaxID=2700081 RepID=UPI00039FF213|nr:sulfur carrier protein ThiS [Virgibacillus sp. MSP4-1]QHS22392.1 sulfur carrier protein ThiS [Virgibacillus sp. MSP4-1]